ncbi:hypothetical protein [Rhizobium sp.]|uniref:hypothetical protein n=1 Tax=Rhizobium sp. TaxID=391 RepID=UPI0028A8235D
MADPHNSHSPSIIPDSLASSELDVLLSSEPSASAAKDQAKKLIEGASANFNEALTSTVPIYFAVLGLDAILQAVRLCLDITQAAPLAAADISKNGLEMALRISDAVANKDLTDEIAVGFGAANALVTLSDDALRYDRFLQVAMLLSNLRVHLCRSEIRRRGGLLMRHIDAHTAWNAAAPSATSLQ